MSEQAKEAAFSAWIASVDRRRDADGFVPLTGREVNQMRAAYFVAYDTLHTENERLRELLDQSLGRIKQLRQVVTVPHDSKEAFIARVRNILERHT